MNELTNDTVGGDVLDRLAEASRRSVWTTLLVLIAIVLGAAALATATSSDARAGTGSRTQQIVLRPVTARGHPATGYRAVGEHRTVECSERSEYAVDAGIASCGISADYAPSCWASHIKGRVLCLRDPFSHTLVSLRLSGAFPATREPSHARPQALQLDNGSQFLARIGGAWSLLKEHPSWYGYFFARHGTHTLYGPGGSNGVNRAHPRWTVTAYARPTGHGARHLVDKAYYVGAAR